MQTMKKEGIIRHKYCTVTLILAGRGTWPPQPPHKNIRDVAGELWLEIRGGAYIFHFGCYRSP